MTKQIIVATNRPQLFEIRDEMINRLGSKVVKWSDTAIETSGVLYHLAIIEVPDFNIGFSISDYEVIDLSRVIEKLQGSVIELSRINSSPAITSTAAKVEVAKPDEDMQYDLPPAKADLKETVFDPTKEGN